MSNMITQQLWLMRGISEKKSLMFSLSICVEEEEPGLFDAAVLSMRDQMAAMGRTEQEAVENACLLFKATVDDALDRGASIEYATGQQTIALDIPIVEAQKFFHLLSVKLNEQPDMEHQWRGIQPVTALQSQSQYVDR